MHEIAIVTNMLNKNTPGVKRCGVNKKQPYLHMCDQKR